MKNNYEFTLNRKSLKVDTKKFAKLATTSVFVEYEGTSLLTVLTASKKQSILGYFPLQVVVQEKMYSVGKIPGGFLKREGRPSDHEILIGRLIDRSLRPLFDENYNHELQIITHVLSCNTDIDLQSLSLFSASLAAGLSDIPFAGPVSGCNVSKKDGNYNVFGPEDIKGENSLNIFAAGTTQKINMLEADADEESSKSILKAISIAQKQIKTLNKFQNEIIEECGKTKIKVSNKKTPEAERKIRDLYQKRFTEIIKYDYKKDRNTEIELLINEIANNKKFEEYRNTDTVNETVRKIFASETRNQIINEKIRPDGRKLDEIRKLHSEVDVLEHPHGTAMFERGETQVLSVLTLGSLKEGKLVDGLFSQDDKYFMHHYNFPNFSVGETGRIGFTSRREVGHGALGEKALLRVLPDVESFPYTIRLVSEVLTSNGSTSQASICAGCMALMAGGVPIKNPIAGIAMGVIQEGKKRALLTDIAGIEDHIGDMDFKISGTKNGICAIQLDIKIDGLDSKLIAETLDKSQVAISQILDNMATAIEKPRKELSKYAPKFSKIVVKKDQIKVVIGQGGKTVNEIIEKCGDVKIDINDNGNIFIYHHDSEQIEKAVNWIKKITWEPKMGETYDVVIRRIEVYGAFAQIKNSRSEGLIHISNISEKRIDKVTDVFKIGSKVRAKIIKIDEKKRIQLSTKNLL